VHRLFSSLNHEEMNMTDADFAYLMLIIGSFSLFTAVLGYYTIRVPSRD